MNKRIIASPPESLSNVTPSKLFTYMRKIAAWENQDIVTLINSYNTNDVINLNTVKSWGSRDFIPSEDYREAFLCMIRDNTKLKYQDLWVEAFLTCWASFKSGLTKTPIDILKQSTRLLDNHEDWICQIYSKPIMGEKFSIEQIYIPLKLIAFGVEAGLEPRDQIFDANLLTRFAKQGFQESDSINGIDNNPSWVFVKGGPGSGKSVLAVSLAQELAGLRDIKPIFSRLGRSLNAISFGINDAFETASDKFSIWSYIDTFKTSKYKTACLIVDGLDEIGSSGQASLTHVAEKLIWDLDRQITECRQKFGKSLRIIAFGREIITEKIAKNFALTSKLFSMGNLANRFSDESLKDRYGDDLRLEWWTRFITARGGNKIDKLPDFLSYSRHSLYQLGKEPLLAYLISLSALPAGHDLPRSPSSILNKKVKGKNRNTIYKEIIGEVLKPKRWRTQINAVPILPYQEFHDVLKYVALATWQNGNSRSATLSGIREAIGNQPKLQFAFDRLTDVESAQVRNFHSGNLITAFYYRLVPSIEDKLEDEFEFTHKTFSEYLLATLLFDHFEALLDSEINTTSETGKLGAIRKWLELTIAGSETHDIAAFIIDEAELRWANRPFTHWCKALPIIDFILAKKSLGFKDNGQWRLPYSNIETYSRGVEFIYFFWAAINAKNWKETNEKFNIENLEMKRFSIEEISRFQRPMFIDVDSSISDRIPNKIGTSFLGYSMSGQEISAEDLTGANFQHGHIYGTNISASYFICSVWQGTILENCKFDAVAFIQSMFNNISCRDLEFEDCDFNRTWFEGAVFDFSNFRECTIKQVFFYDCTFNNCTFENTDFEFCHFVKCRFHFPKPFQGGLMTNNKTFLNQFREISAQSMNLKLPEFKQCLFGKTGY